MAVLTALTSADGIDWTAGSEGNIADMVVDS
jgi:hypothetical protein